MRITTNNLDQTILTNRLIEREVKVQIALMEKYWKKVRVHSPEKQALQILKENNLIQMPIPDSDWGGAIYELPNGHRIPVINTAQPRLYQYFICWHEVYHLIEGAGLGGTHNISADFELSDRKADYFAGQMLISNDLLDYYHQLKGKDFLDKSAYCMDMFKAPYKAILIQLYEQAVDSEDLILQATIKQYFDLHLSQEEWVEIFRKLALDESLVIPTYILDFGKLKEAVLEKSKSHSDVEVFTQNEKFVIRLEEKFRRIKEGLENGHL